MIPNRVDISQRSSDVNLRNEERHYEADTVLSSKGGKVCLAVFVERKTRMYFLQKIKDKSAGEMLSATMKVFRDSKEFGPLKVLSITYDNGTENANHELVNRMLNCKSFFCAPYHSWEKGQIENRNKILRQFFPKGTNFDLISDKEIHNILICPFCTAEGVNKEWELDEMEGDHITPWHEGGRSIPENCVMLCKAHNRQKGGI